MIGLPGLKVEIAFGIQAIGGDYFTLNDPVKGVLDNDEFLIAPDDIWVDMAPFIDVGGDSGGAPLTINRGRNRELEAFQAGVLTFTLRNDDRQFDPFNEDSPFWPEIKPRKRVRVTAEVDGVPVRLFAGFIEDWPIAWQAPHYSHITVRAFDAIGMLARLAMRERHTPVADGDRTGERIRRVLASPEVEFPHIHDIADGLTRVTETTFGTDALSHMQLMERSEMGWLFTDAEGTLVFRDRHHALSRSPEAVLSDGTQAEIHDVYADGYPDEYQSSMLVPAGIRYADISLIPSTDLLFNRVEVDHPDFEAVSAEDRASRREYLTSTHSRTVATSNAEERQSQADELLRRYSQPEQRLTGARFNLRFVPKLDWLTLLRLDMVSRVRVLRTPPGGGSTIVQECLVDGVEHRVTQAEWAMTLSLSLADTRAFLRLDDPVYGMLGANRVAL